MSAADGPQRTGALPARIDRVYLASASLRPGSHDKQSLCGASVSWTCPTACCQQHQSAAPMHLSKVLHGHGHGRQSSPDPVPAHSPTFPVCTSRISCVTNSRGGQHAVLSKPDALVGFGRISVAMDCVIRIPGGISSMVLSAAVLGGGPALFMRLSDASLGARSPPLMGACPQTAITRTHHKPHALWQVKSAMPCFLQFPYSVRLALCSK